ncbi:MAG: beta-L-arabinofuranosidase domain-containing protein, partial [Planctomycetota bacterium]
MTRKLLFGILCLAVGCQGLAGGAGREVIEFKARPFGLKQVRLLDGPFKDNMERTRKYLHELDSGRLLHTFRLNAGLPSSAEPLGGWEKPAVEVRGHTLGHYLSACALMYASTGDEKLKAKAETIVAELAKCQKALGQSGYLSAFPESFIERTETLKRVWAPYYVLHKIYAGLMDMHVHCVNAQALEIARKMAAWNKGRLDKLDRSQMQQMLNRTEQGGMNDAFANLYALTGEAGYLAISRRFNQDRYVEPLSRGEDRLKGEHVNSFIPNIIGTARQYELGGDERDRKIAEYFWSQVVEHRSYCTGGTSNSEHWYSEPDKLAHELGDHTQETCCTYNMLKLTRHLFTWNAEGCYADYYERALYNSILSTQNPRTGMMMYFVPLATGRWKMYNLPYDSFWCCTGSGLENHGKYGDSIYFHKGNTLFVNLFVASELDWSEKGFNIRQETNFPREDNTTLILKTQEPQRLRIVIRVPYWARDGATLKVDGQSPTRGKPVLFPSLPNELRIERTWRDGDKIKVSMPMSLHAHPMPDDPTLVAFMYGPLVLAGQLGGEGLTDENTHTGQNWYKFPQPIPAVEPLIVESDDVADWIKPVGGKPLTFRTAGQSKAITLVPYHELLDQRYVVYWRVLKKGGKAHKEYLAEQRKREEMLGRIVDSVDIGKGESEKAHNLQGERTQSGAHAGRNWRDARDGGWFSYDLKILPDEAATLLCTYWGSDVGRTFDVVVNG